MYCVLLHREYTIQFHCKVHSAHYTVHSALCTVHTTQYKVLSAQCTLDSTNYPVINAIIPTRPPLDLLDHQDQEPLRISLHEDERDIEVLHYTLFNVVNPEKTHFY